MELSQAARGGSERSGRSAIRFGISVNIGNPHDIRGDADRARRAEELGFDSVWFQDNPLIWKDCIVAMALAADRTSSIIIGSSVLATDVRSAAILASGVNTVHSLAPGRVILGMGTGGVGHMMNIPRRTRAQLRSDIGTIRTLLDGDWCDFAGCKARLLGAEGRVPVYIAAGGPKLAELAGEIADGVIIAGHPNRDFRDRVAMLSPGLKKSGRTLADLDVGAALHFLMTDDIQRDIDYVKPLCCHLAEHVDVGDVRIEELPKLYPPSLRHWDDLGAAMRHAAAIVSDDAALEFARTRGLIGTIDDFSERIDFLVAAGVTHFDLKAVIKSGPPREMDRSMRDTMEAFSEAIISRYRRAPATSGDQVY